MPTTKLRMGKSKALSAKSVIWRKKRVSKGERREENDQEVVTLDASDSTETELAPVDQCGPS